MKRKVLILAAVLAFMLAFVACGNDGNGGAGAEVVATPAPATPAPAPPVVDLGEGEEGLDIDDILDELDPSHPLYQLHRVQQRFPLMTPPHGEAISGGTLFVGHSAGSPVPGVFNAIFSTTVDDTQFTQWAGIGSSIFSMLPNMQMGQHGIATFTFDVEAQTITITQVEDVYWHDGVPLTLNDVVFAIEQISTPGYMAAGGMRFTAGVHNIVGVWDFHNGYADHISGLNISPDHRTLTVEFESFTPAILYFGFWTTPYPRHIFENVPIGEQAEHPATRVNPIGWGPFIFQNIVPGESAHLVANENYWLGRPYLDEVVITRIEPTMVIPMLLNGDIDIVPSFPIPFFPDMRYPPNFTYLGDVGNFFNYVAFNLGRFDTETNRIIHHENPRMGNANLRRAMALAVDEQLLTDHLFHGLRFPATSIIPPGHSTFLDPSLRGFAYDPDLARQLLDEAGFIDIDGDGWREFPDGSELEIHFVMGAPDDPNQQIVAQHYAEHWEAIGLRVWIDWVDWAAMTANIFNADNWEWDVITAGWQAGANPDPNMLWGHTMSNRGRWVSERMENHLEGFSSANAWDEAWLINHYHEWQRIFYEEVSAFPTNWRVALHAANHRVLNYYVGQTQDGVRTRGGLHHIQLSAPSPITQ